MISTRPIPGAAGCRRLVLSLAKLLLLGLTYLPALRAAPTKFPHFVTFAEDELDPKPADDPSLWIYMSVAVVLVLLGGAFAGLTIALMGQDEINLQVIQKSGIGAERKHAKRVLRLLTRGKHWVLVTLLLSNVITNETLPIVLDRSLGGGWPAVVGSTVAIVIFGEIIPQSICVRYGLSIGAWMSPFVLVLMFVLSPVAWPTAKLLDYLIGEEHGTTYSKAGLKTLVTIHKSFGEAGERLNEDEVTIIGAVLELKNKPVGDIMTPMDDVFIMSADTILDEKMMDIILSAGYSRIPIHATDNPMNFVGMLLVKILITYDPEDCKPVRDFSLATLPETRPETSCLDILNFFQEGKSHMVLVSENPGQNDGAVGVLTLEDVIEELIGEEIIDESDVFVDVHKAIRRMHPAPRTRVPKGEVVTEPKDNAGQAQEGLLDHNGERASHGAVLRTAGQNSTPEKRVGGASADASSPSKTMLCVRRTSSIAAGSDREFTTRKAETPDMREHLKHLGPSNLASRPRSTRFQSVKIKPGTGEGKNTVVSMHQAPSMSQQTITGGVGEGMLSDAGIDASDGVQALHVGYGTMDRPRTPKPLEGSNKATQATLDRPQATRTISERSTSTLGSLPSRENGGNARAKTPRGTTRSGSITENIIESNGIRKLILDISSSSEDVSSKKNTEETAETQDESQNLDGKKSGGKKKRRRKRKKGSASESEGAPLLSKD